MMIPPVTDHYARLHVAGISTFLLFLLALSITISHGWRHKSPSRSATAPGALQLDRDDFISAWLNVHTGDPTDGYTISQLCHNRAITWYPNLIVNVDDANGGIGNIRGNLFDFVYFAMVAGASIVLPSFAGRSKDDLSNLFDHRSPFSTFFDEAHFVSTFRTHCPEMHIYTPESVPSLHAIEARYVPSPSRNDLNPADTSAAASQRFHTWLRTEQNLTLPPDAPTIVHLGRTLWDGPDTFSFSPRMRRDFGSTLRLTPSARALAAATTHRLAQRFGLDLDPTAPYYPSAFFGAHLRTEPDAVRAGWTAAGPHANFTGQTDAYLAQAAAAGLRVVYAASGDPADLEAFRRKAWDGFRVNVTDKTELLAATPQAAELERLSWDQRALVDWEVLVRCSEFGGFVKSSFSFNIAVTRAAVGEKEGRVEEEPWWVVDPGERERRAQSAWRDRWSTVWGRDDFHERKITRGAWP